MIGTNELRVGNVIQCIDENITANDIISIVTCIDNDSEDGYSVTMLNGRLYKCKELFGVYLNSKVLECINDVKKIDNDSLWEAYNVGNLILERGLFGDFMLRKKFTRNDSIFLKKVEHLHELQNLYFALEGKELEIDIEKLRATLL